MLNRFIVILCALTATLIGGSSTASAQSILLKKLLISDTEAKVSALAADSGGNAGVFVQDVPVLLESTFPPVVEKYLGQPITNDLLNVLANAIAGYARQHDRLIVKVLPPNQDISGGLLRLAVVVGRYNDLQFRGNRWFSSKLLQEKLGIKAGDEVRISTLEDAVKWANANPFRQIKVLVNDLNDKPGKADLLVGVEERIPVRFTASFDDSGSEVIGSRHYSGAIQFGNLWGRDHQGSYQFTTTDHQAIFQSHSIDYRVPLPWRHYLQFTGGYLRVNPTFGAGGVFRQTGENINASLRYVLPIRTGDHPVEFTTGIDFKEGNNNFAYGGQFVPQLSGTTDTFQLTAALSMVKRDARGAWLFGLNVNASPGNINERNTDTAFSRSRFNTRATYLTATLSAQRLLNLSRDWSVFSRAVVQAASAHIPGSEQLSIGGSSTVRGFEERIYTGDQGFVFSNDLQTPPIRYTLPFLKKRPPSETRFVVFYDAAQVFYKFPDANDIILTPLASTGVGLRMSLPANFNLSADYGWQVTHFSRELHPGPLNYHPPTHSRGHVKVVLAF